MQGTRVQSLVWEDFTCCAATKPVCHAYWAWAPRARLLQHRQWEAWAPQLDSSPHSLQLEKACTARRPRKTKKKKIFYSEIYLFILYESESCSVMSDYLWPHGLYIPWNSRGQNTVVSSLSLLQGIFPTQGSNPGLLHFRRILYQLSYHGTPFILCWSSTISGY